VPLFGGPSQLPDHTFAEVETSAAPAPDVVVVPAVGDPSGAVEAPLRGWITRQAVRGARILAVCTGSQVLAASGLLDGRRATSHWAAIESLQAGYPRVSWVRGLPMTLNENFPWLRPTVGIKLVDGVDEINASAAFEVYNMSSAARALPV
jgi:putative intracellular protease/amidase